MRRDDGLECVDRLQAPAVGALERKRWSIFHQLKDDEKMQRYKAGDESCAVRVRIWAGMTADRSMGQQR